MYKVEISNSENGVLSFDLWDVLSSLPGSVSEFVWYLLEIEAVGKGLGGESIIETESKAESSVHGIELELSELKVFASNLEQTVNASLVGMKRGASAPSLPLQMPYKEPFIVIEAIDSSEWIVTSRDTSVTTSVLHHFLKQCWRTGFIGDTSLLGELAVEQPKLPYDTVKNKGRVQMRLLYRTTYKMQGSCLRRPRKLDRMTVL